MPFQYHYKGIIPLALPNELTVRQVKIAFLCVTPSSRFHSHFEPTLIYLKLYYYHQGVVENGFTDKNPIHRQPKILKQTVRLQRSGSVTYKCFLRARKLFQYTESRHPFAGSLFQSVISLLFVLTYLFFWHRHHRFISGFLIEKF